MLKGRMTRRLTIPSWGSAISSRERLRARFGGAPPLPQSGEPRSGARGQLPDRPIYDHLCRVYVPAAAYSRIVGHVVDHVVGHTGRCRPEPGPVRPPVRVPLQLRLTREIGPRVVVAPSLHFPASGE